MATTKTLKPPVLPVNIAMSALEVLINKQPQVPFLKLRDTVLGDPVEMDFDTTTPEWRAAYMKRSADYYGKKTRRKVSLIARTAKLLASVISWVRDRLIKRAKSRRAEPLAQRRSRISLSIAAFGRAERKRQADRVTRFARTTSKTKGKRAKR